MKGHFGILLGHEAVPALFYKNVYFLLPPFSGVCSKPQQDAAHHRHPAQEPDQTNRLLEQLPEGSHRRRAVQRREDLPNQTDQGSEETGLLEKHLSLPSVPTFYR